MKWVILLAMIVAIPMLVRWLIDNPKKAPLVTAALGALPFVYAPWHLNVAPISWALWSGYVRGVEITALDVVALAIVLSKTHRSYKLPFQWQMWFYFIAVLISIPFANLSYPASFYLWQLLRMYLVFRAVALAATDDRHRNALIAGMIAGLCFQAVSAGIDRLNGAVQSGGSLVHQNLLGLLCHMVIYLALAMLLAGIRPRIAVLGVAAGACAYVFTASRASIAMAGVGVVLMIVVSVIRKSSGRKMGMAALAGLALIAAAPFAMNSLSKRFGGNSNIDFGVNSDGEREAFERAAWMMINDNPMGVGPNNYVVVANTKGYSAKAGVVWNWGSRSAHVHNSYLLVLAETGSLGLAALLVLLGSFLLFPYRVAFGNRNDYRSEIVLGAGVGVTIFLVHCFFEWAIVSVNVQYMLMITMGLIAGTAKAITVSRRRGRSKPSRAPAIEAQALSDPEGTPATLSI